MLAAYSSKGRGGLIGDRETAGDEQNEPDEMTVFSSRTGVRSPWEIEQCKPDFEVDPMPAGCGDDLGLSCAEESGLSRYSRTRRLNESDFFC